MIKSTCNIIKAMCIGFGFGRHVGFMKMLVFKNDVSRVIRVIFSFWYYVGRLFKRRKRGFSSKREKAANESINKAIDNGIIY